MLKKKTFSKKYVSKFQALSGVSAAPDRLVQFCGKYKLSLYVEMIIATKNEREDVREAVRMGIDMILRRGRCANVLFFRILQIVKPILLQQSQQFFFILVVQTMCVGQIFHMMG